MLVDGYEQFRDFDRAELELLEPLRTLQLIHYSAWLAPALGQPHLPGQLSMVWLQRRLAGPGADAGGTGGGNASGTAGSLTQAPYRD
jgi:Ser/Thr protein kinase RdoA (MazF antagonist)